METLDKDIQEMKNRLEQAGGREFTWDEATIAFRGIQTLAEIASKQIIEDCKRKNQLEISPKGFHLNGEGKCAICGKSASEENSWFDKYGLKCMTCQRAINAKVIPGSIARDKQSWYSKYDLDIFFNINAFCLKKYIKQSILKERIIQGEGKRTHLQLFLIKDNKNVLPPKKFLKSRIVKTMWKDEEYYTNENWYEFIDIKSFERLRKYKIIDCLEETFAKPIQNGRFYFKTINPLFIP